MLKCLDSGAVDILGAVVTEAVVFGLVSERIKTSESQTVVLRAKGAEAVCLASHVSGIAVIFCASLGDVVILVPQGAIVAEAELEDPETADMVVLNVSVLK